MRACRWLIVLCLLSSSAGAQDAGRELLWQTNAPCRYDRRPNPCVNACGGERASGQEWGGEIDLGLVSLPMAHEDRHPRPLGF
jgi:hypothetical protein